VDQSIEQPLELGLHRPRANQSGTRTARSAPQSLRRTASRASAAVSSG
jgi:hypothetical protein